MSLRLIYTPVVILFCAVLTWGTYRLAVSSEPATAPDDDVRLFMRAKLSSCQKVLEGLVVEDYAKIEKGAAEMRQLSKGSHWPQADDKVYNHFNTAFQAQCEKLEQLAGDRNREGVKFTYLQITTSCVDCHDYVRRRFEIKRPTSNQGPVQLIPTYWDDKKKQ